MLNNKLSPHPPFTDICYCKCPLAWISWRCDNQHANLEVHWTLRTSFPASSWLDWKIAQHAVTSSIQAQPTKRHLKERYLRPNHHAGEFALEDGYLWFLLSLIIPMPPRPPDWAGYNFSNGKYCSSGWCCCKWWTNEGMLLPMLLSTMSCFDVVVLSAVPTSRAWRQAWVPHDRRERAQLELWELHPR